MTSETLCWSHEGEKDCYWQRAWNKLYKIACNMAKDNNELRELLNKLGEEE